jgi:hypothetical protein
MLDSGQTCISRGRSRPVDKAFGVFAPDQGSLVPPSLDDWLPAEHLARFVAARVTWRHPALSSSWFRVLAPMIGMTCASWR